MTKSLTDLAGDDYVENVVGVVVDSTKTYTIAIDSLPKAYGYDGSGNIITETAGPDASGNTFVKTYSYVSGRISTESAWVKQ